MPDTTAPAGTQPRQARGTPGGIGGQWVNRLRPDAEGNLPGPTAIIATVNGPTEVLTNQWTPRAADAFQSGQCLAFAVAAAEALNLTEIHYATRTDDDRIIHAWVERDDTIIDSEGQTDRQDHHDFYDTHYGWDGWVAATATVDEARTGLFGLTKQMPEQGWDQAAQLFHHYRAEHL